MDSKKLSLKRKAIIHAKTQEERKTRILGKTKLNLKKKRSKTATRKGKVKFIKPGYKKSTYARVKGKAVNKLHFETDLLGMASSGQEKTNRTKASSTKGKAKGGTTKTTSTMASNAKAKSASKAKGKAKSGSKATSTKSNASSIKGNAYTGPIKTIFKKKVKVKASKAPEGVSSKVMKNGATITRSVAKIKFGRKVLWEREDFQDAVKLAKSQARKKKKKQ